MMEQDKIDELEIELKSKRDARKMYNGEDIDLLLKLYKEENEILRQKLDAVLTFIKDHKAVEKNA